MKIGIGTAPCGNCGKQINNIQVDAESVESDGNGGWWYKGVPGQFCPDCREPLNWYHIPAKKENENV